LRDEHETLGTISKYKLVIILLVILTLSCSDKKQPPNSAPHSSPPGGSFLPPVGASPPPATPTKKGIVSQAVFNQILALDPRFSQPRLRDFLAATFLHPEVGLDLWEAAKKGSQGSNPTFEGLLKSVAQPWIRPLLMDTLENGMKADSTLLQNRVANGHHSTSQYNVVVIGAGPNGVVAALNLKQANHDLKVAVLDSAELPGDVFRTFGLFTWINSPETPAFSTNEFVGMPIAVKDLLPAGSVSGGPFFVLPELISDMTVLTAFVSHVDLWLTTEVQRLHPTEPHHPGRIEVITRHPGHPELSLTTDQVLIMTGLGHSPLYGLPENSKPPQPPENLVDVPGEEHFDHLTARASQYVAQNRLVPTGSRRSFMQPYVGKRIAIIGAGDSSNNMAELASGYGYPELYGLVPAGVTQPGRLNGLGIHDPQGPAQVLWVNQKFQTANKFQAGSKPRYRNTVFQSFTSFDRTTDRLVDVHRHPGGHYTLVLKSPVDGTETQKDVDYIWYGTGYQLASSSLFQHLFPAAPEHISVEEHFKNSIINMDSVRGDIQVTAPGPHFGQTVETLIGRKLPDHHPLAGTYLGGPAAGQLATAQELQDDTVTKNPASLNANLPRAAALGKHIARLRHYSPLPLLDVTAEDLPTDALPRGFTTVTLNISFGGGAVPILFPRPVTEIPPQADSVHRKAYEEIALRLSLVKLLHQYSTSHDFRIRLIDSGAGSACGSRCMQIGVDQLTGEMARDEIIPKVSADLGFLKIAQDYAHLNSSPGKTQSTCFTVRGSTGQSRITPEKIDMSAGCN
jgi:cation diffusion facilitator CzcD-associated flavoprotein CzcO